MDRPARTEEAHADAESAAHSEEEAIADAHGTQSAPPVPETATVATPIDEPSRVDRDVPAVPPGAQRLDERLRERREAAVTAVDDTPPPPASAVGQTVATAQVAMLNEATQDAATITRVSMAERADGRGLVLRMHSSGPIPAHVVETVAEGRLQLTLFRTGVSDALRRDDPRGGIKSYSLASAEGRTILTLDVEPELFYERQPYPDRDSHDLLLSLVRIARPVAEAQTPARTAATNGSNGVDAASQARWRFDCIVIDPGHGGKDPGAVAHGVRESDVNLGIALRLGRYIEDNLGVRVVYTRRDDRFLELAERGRIANQSCGKLFVSIHANSAANRSAQGTETYFLGVHRSESARRVMERENSVIALESDPSLYSGMDEAALIMQTMAQSTYLRVSEQLASLIEGQFSGHANRNSRGVKQAGFLVLWRASMPAVLVETGFITNPQEARFLSSAEGQDRMAHSIYRAIREFKQQYERGLGIAAN